MAGLLAAKTWFKSLPWEAWALVALAAMGVIIRRDAYRDGRRDRTAEIIRVQAEANERARKKVNELKEETNERIERANEARDTVTATASADELPDAARDRYFGDRAADN